MRCSALPRIFACHQSRIKPDVEINIESPQAQFGTDVHKAISDYLKTGEEVKIDSKEKRIMYSRAIRFIEQLKEMGLSLHNVEGKETSGLIDGTPDVVMVSNEKDYVIDWKTGRIERDYTRQLQGYVYMVSGKMGGVGITFDLRNGEYKIVEFDENDMAEFETELNKIITSETYSPGYACEFCPRAHECIARNQLVKSTISELSEGVVDILTPAIIVDIEDKVDIIKNIVKEYEKQRKLYVEENGPITLRDGRVMSVEDVKKQKITLTPELFLELPNIINVKNSENAIGQLSGGITISREKLNEVLIQNKTERGKIGEYIKLKMEQIEKTGAIQTTGYTKITKKAGGK